MSTIPSNWELSRTNANKFGVFLTVSVCSLVLCACLIGAFGARLPATSVHLSWANLFDTAVSSQLNSLVNRWPLFDSLMLITAEHNLLKGAPIVFLCWAAFFEKRSGPDPMAGRRKLVSVIPLAIGSVFLARILAVVLPFRERPFRTAALHFQLPHGSTMDSIYSWSSFPSDHAAIFMALAVGVFFASRRLGALAISYVALFIIGPRAYLGIHWPTDMLAGAALGTAFAAVATIPAYSNFVWRCATRSWEFSPGAVAASMFLLSYEITDLFATPIAIASMLLKHKRL